MATREEVIREFALVPLDEQGIRFQSPVNEGVFEVEQNGAVTWFDGDVIRRRLPNQDRFVTVEDRPSRIREWITAVPEAGIRAAQQAARFLFDPRTGVPTRAETPQPTVAPPAPPPVQTAAPQFREGTRSTAEGVLSQRDALSRDMGNARQQTALMASQLLPQFRQAAEAQFFSERGIDASDTDARNEYLQDNPEEREGLAMANEMAMQQAQNAAIARVESIRAEQGLPPMEQVASDLQALNQIAPEAIVSEQQRAAEDFAGPNRQTRFIADPSQPEQTVMPPWWSQAVQPTRPGEQANPFYGRAQPVDASLDPMQRAAEIARREEERADIASAYLRSRRELQPERIAEEQAAQAAAMRESMQERARLAGGEVDFPEAGLSPGSVGVGVGEDYRVQTAYYQPKSVAQLRAEAAAGTATPQVAPQATEVPQVQPITQITPANVYDVMRQRGISLEGMPAEQVTELMNFRAGEGGIPAFLQPQQTVPEVPQMQPVQIAPNAGLLGPLPQMQPQGFEQRGEMAPTQPQPPSLYDDQGNWNPQRFLSFYEQNPTAINELSPAGFRTLSQLQQNPQAQGLNNFFAPTQ